MLTQRQKEICLNVLRWYRRHRRDLPWRKTRDPYMILVSEVMLQQTQVDRVVPKYREFLRAFPTIQKLAGASIGEVIRIWKGLGYNRRALFLHRAAQRIVRVHRGRFPRTVLAIRELPGVGEYTARAVLSFAFGVPVAVVDTNHRAFYQKIFFPRGHVSDRELWKKAEEVVAWIERTRGSSVVYDWNQALMDLGSSMRERRSRPQQRLEGKRAVPFKESDRYFRGRIVDLLRREDRREIRALRKQFPEISDDRFEKILGGLARDGLIVRKRGSILFP